MIRINLDDAIRAELQSLRRKALAPKVRDRIEMLSLADAGWSAPRIAAHLGQTVRDLLKDFRQRGTDALFPRRTGPAPAAVHKDSRGRGSAYIEGRRRAGGFCCTLPTQNG